MNHPRGMVLAWMFGAAALVAGCGGNHGDDAATPAAGEPVPSPSPSPSPSPTPSPAPAPAPAPASIARTEAGVPEGLPASATIGTAGGTLVSSDGRLTISVPAGALAADTLVGIQPITATAPGSFGSGYRLSPDGNGFAQPVTLTFSYLADEAAASAAGMLRVATRDARGYWRMVEPARDAAQRKLSVTTAHFSDWSYVGGRQITPASATVAVNKQQPLRVIDCGEGPDPDTGNAQQRLLLECIEEELPPLARNWSVNAVAGGNSAVGTVVGGSSATYGAPAAVPAQNPVAVSAQVGTSAGLVTLVSNVKVVEQLTVYAGTIFTRLVIRLNGEEQFMEASANLRFTYNPQLSTGGALWYDGSGTAIVRGKPFGCGEGQATAPVQDATLVLQTEGPLAGTYALGGGAIATVTLTCGNSQLTGPFLIGGLGASGNDICPALQIGGDPGRLAGSWSCNVAEGSTQRANWTLRAIE